MLLTECIILSLLFTIIMLVPLYKNPIGQIMSYPKEIRNRVELLNQYKDTIKKTEKKHISIKLLGILIFAFVLGIVAYLSGKTTFIDVFIHVFILFLFVNLYDLFIMDLLLLRNIKAFRIPGTEDMDKEYKGCKHHIIGAIKGILIDVVVALLSASLIQIYNLF